MNISRGASRSSKPEINMTPLIDVLLVLLIIFMVVSPIKPREFETKVPVPSTDAPVVNDQALVLTLAANNLTLKLNESPINPMDVTTILGNILDKRSSDQRAVFIKAPKTVPYREVVRIVDLAKGAGARPIGLQLDYLED